MNISDLTPPTAAKKVLKGIIALVKSLNNFPLKYPAEPLLSGEGNFRFVTRWSYKIIYEVTEKETIIAYIFHAKQNPQKLL